MFDWSLWGWALLNIAPWVDYLGPLIDFADIFVGMCTRYAYRNN